MRAAKPNEHSNRSQYPTGASIGAALGSLAVIVLALMLLLSHRGVAPPWPAVHGHILETRIVPDRAVETKWGAQVMWKAEYRVAYSVGNRAYALWGDSGIRGESTAEVQLALAQSSPACQVQYNPERPETAIAHCSKVQRQTQQE